MPAPEPNAVWVERPDGRITATYETYFWTGNVGNRKARAIAIMKRMLRHDWRCRWCSDELPVWRRADARYCCEGCRKKAARLRRKDRSDWRGYDE
mgnify:CR=1 FL=1